MQEEIENRSVNLVITTTRLSTRALMDGIRQFVNNANANHRLAKESRSREEAVRMEAKARQAEQKKAEGPHGKQTVKQLVQHSNGVKKIELAEGSMKDLQRILRKYGVDFALLKDASAEKPRYLAFFKAKDEDVMASVLKEYAIRKEKRAERPSMLTEMKKLKEMIAKAPKKAHRKEKDLSR